MSDFIKLHRVKDVKGKDKELEVYINPAYIISFDRPTDSDKTYIDIFFPDTMRTYKVIETPEEIASLLKSNVGEHID